ncbi:MAG: leucine-rich repeat domain-containing protein [Candidatus Methanomethylophilaceae archaeon]|nr:leucine-rich repeat domain-containing protein [Candidatus Methanomethylophilaceae archaeon]
MAPGVAPDSADIGKTVYQRMDEGRVRVLRYQGGKPRVEIPPGIYVAKKEYSVIEIGEGAFAGHPELASVSLPDCIETIGDKAFEGCSGIVEIDIPRGTASIRGNAFAGCSRLETVRMPDSPKKIGKHAFDGCSSLKAFIAEKGKGDYVSDKDGCLYDDGSDRLFRVPYAMSGTVDVPPGTKEIAGEALSGCVGVTSVRIPASVEKIGDRILSGCGSVAMIYVNPRNEHFRSDLQGILYDSEVTEVVRAPNSVTGELEIPATVRRIRMNAFEKCAGLTSVTIPYGTTIIEDSAFEGCSKIRRLSLSGSIRSIGEGAFRGCAGIVSVTIPDSVEEIGDGAFAGCSRLVSASIPMGTRLGERVFPTNCDIRLERRTGKKLNIGIVWADAWTGKNYSRRSRTASATPARWQGPCRNPDSTRRTSTPCAS